MRVIFYIGSIVLFCQCSNKQVTTSSKEDRIPRNRQCIRSGGENFKFSYDDFSSEGADGIIFFDNDTLLDKIFFNYATSMFYVEQQYYFLHNRLIKYKQIKNYINPEKTDYSKVDSVILEKEDITKHKEFSEITYQKLIQSAIDKNPCWK